MSVATTPPESPTADRSWFGHPRGVAILSGTELAERFSYYGMTALLVLYMVKQLLLPGHAENVIGLSAVRRLFEFRGPMSDQAFASLIYGWYGGLVYVTPIIGGWVADRLLGTKRTVVIGALLMAAGHLAMSFDATFLFALALLILGSGFLKGNISAQVGTLYPAEEESRRERGYAIYSTGINVGSTAGPLATGAVAAAWGWHAGFALAAILMVVALVVYLAGSSSLPESKPVAATEERRPLTGQERKRILGLILLFLIVVLPNIAYSMIWNVGILWVDQRVVLGTSLGDVPASWFNSVDAFASIVIAAPLVALWAWQSRRGNEPASIIKMAIGAAIIGVSALVLSFADQASGGGKVSVWWALIGFFGMGIAFMWYWPVLLALVSKVAPSRVNGTMMGVAFLTLFAGVTLMGWVGSFYETMSPAAFWRLDAVIGFAGAILMLMCKRPIEALIAQTLEN